MAPVPRKPQEFTNDFPHRLGILLIAEIGVVSLISVIGLLVVTLIRAFKQYTAHHVYPTDRPLFQPVSAFFVAAIIMDGIQAIGSALGLKWALEGAITAGPYCTAQGVLKQFGNTGIALFTVSISVMTYISVVRRVPLTSSRSNQIVATVIGFILVFLFLIILIPATTMHMYYDTTGLWCWINGRTAKARRMRIGLEYLFIWIAALVSLVLYGLIIRRYLREANEGRRKVRDAIIMGWYPVAYIIQILPISIIRFMSFNHDLSRDYSVIGGIFFTSSGLVNVILWNLTGRHFGFSRDDGGNTELEQVIQPGEGVIPMGQIAIGDATARSTEINSTSAYEPAPSFDPYARPYDPYDDYYNHGNQSGATP